MEKIYIMTRISEGEEQEKDGLHVEWGSKMKDSKTSSGKILYKMGENKFVSWSSSLTKPF